MPASGSYINIDAAWPGVERGAVDLYCDERCQGYVMVAVVAPGSTDPLQGYEPERCVMTNVNGLRIPLHWSRDNDASVGLEAEGTEGGGVPLAGRVVALRIYYRAATVFSIGAV